MKSKDVASKTTTVALLVFVIVGLLWWYLAGMPAPDQLK